MAVHSILGQLLFEKKPSLPTLPTLSLEEEQKKAIEANQSVLPQLEKQASEVNRFSQEELMKRFRETVPNIDTLLAQAGKNLEAGLKGEIPGDLADRIQNLGAAKGLYSTGQNQFDTGLGKDWFLQATGKTSYDIMNQSLGAFENFMASTKNAFNAPMFDFSSNLVTPAQMANFDVQERNTQWNYNWFKNQLDAQPEPWEKAVEGLLDWIANTGLSVAGGALGGMGGMGAGSGGEAAGMGVNNPNYSFGGVYGEASAGQF